MKRTITLSFYESELGQHFPVEVFVGTTDDLYLSVHNGVLTIYHNEDNQKRRDEYYRSDVRKLRIIDEVEQKPVDNVLTEA